MWLKFYMISPTILGCCFVLLACLHLVLRDLLFHASCFVSFDFLCNSEFLHAVYLVIRIYVFYNCSVFKVPKMFAQEFTVDLSKPLVFQVNKTCNHLFSFTLNGISMPISSTVFLSNIIIILRQG